MQWWQEHRAVLWVILVLLWFISVTFCGVHMAPSVTWTENSIRCAWVQRPWGGSDCEDVPWEEQGDEGSPAEATVSGTAVPGFAMGGKVWVCIFH